MQFLVIPTMSTSCIDWSHLETTYFFFVLLYISLMLCVLSGAEE